jgi:hypothetical protein
MPRIRITIAFALLAFTLPVISVESAPAADTKVFNSENACLGPWGSSNTLWQGPASRFYAPRGATLTSATLRYSVSSGAQSPTNASGQKIAIWSNSGSLPGTLIGRMAYSSASGFYVTFTGNVVIPSAGTYWFQILSNFSAYFCVNQVQDNTGSESGWTSQIGIAYGSSGSGETTTAWTAFGSPQNAYSFAYSLYSSGPETASISAHSLTAAEKGVVDTLTATTSSSGSITFYSRNKKIPKCINLKVLSTNANCLWKPSVTGNSIVYAIFTSSGGSTVKTDEIRVNVRKRLTTR